MPLGQIWNITLPEQPTAEPADRLGVQAPPIFIPEGERESVQELKTKICIHNLPVFVEPEPEPEPKLVLDPILISLVRRAMPNLLANEIMGVQPMSQPSGLIFAMKSKYEKEGEKKSPVEKSPLFNESEWRYEQPVRHTVNSAQAKEKEKERDRVREELLKEWRKAGW